MTKKHPNLISVNVARKRCMRDEKSLQIDSGNEVVSKKIGA